MRRHAANLKMDLIQDRFPDDPSASFALFLATTEHSEMAYGITLEAIVHHFKSFKSKSDLPNVHIFHYEDMRADLADHTRRLAAMLGLEIDDDTLDAIVESMRFESMQANARAKPDQTSQRSATFKDPAAFSDSARSHRGAVHEV